MRQHPKYDCNFLSGKQNWAGEGVKRKGLECLRKKWTCIQQLQYMNITRLGRLFGALVSCFFLVRFKANKKFCVLLHQKVLKVWFVLVKSPTLAWGSAISPWKRLSGRVGSISLWVSSLKRGEECAHAPPIPLGCLRTLAQRPFSHQLD